MKTEIKLFPEADLNSESLRQLCLTQFKARLDLLEKKLAAQDKIGDLTQAIMDQFQKQLDGLQELVLRQQAVLEQSERALNKAIQLLENRDDGDDWWKHG